MSALTAGPVSPKLITAGFIVGGGGALLVLFSLLFFDATFALGLAAVAALVGLIGTVCQLLEGGSSNEHLILRAVGWICVFVAAMIGAGLAAGALLDAVINPHDQGIVGSLLRGIEAAQSIQP